MYPNLTLANRFVQQTSTKFVQNCVRTQKYLKKSFKVLKCFLSLEILDIYLNIMKWLDICFEILENVWKITQIVLSWIVLPMFCITLSYLELSFMNCFVYKCHNITINIISKCCQIISEILFKYCWYIDEILLKYRWNNVRILLKYCQNMAWTLLKNWTVLGFAKMCVS